MPRLEDFYRLSASRAELARLNNFNAIRLSCAEIVEPRELGPARTSSKEIVEPGHVRGPCTVRRDVAGQRRATSAAGYALSQIQLQTRFADHRPSRSQSTPGEAAL